MYKSCGFCVWNEGGKCYNDKIAFIDTTPYQIDGITYTRNGELLDTAWEKCIAESKKKKEKKRKELRKKKIKRLIN